MHYTNLIVRSVLFVSALVVYIVSRVNKSEYLFGGLENNHFLLTVIWLAFMINMLLRFFPSKLESMGCQKYLKKNFKPVPGKEDKPQSIQPGVRTFIAAASWFALNGVIAALYFLSIIDAGILVLVSMAYSVCDIICILFFCPFQTWMLKNKCCTTCRIYNWDYAMMFTPFIFIPNFYTWSLLGVALIMLAAWEISVRRHPERFCESHNKSLACAMCDEKLCRNKRQLQGFLKKGKYNLKGNPVFKASKGEKGKKKS